MKFRAYCSKMKVYIYFIGWVRILGYCEKHFYSSTMCLLSYELNWNIISIYWKLLFNIRIVGSKLFSWPFYAAVICKFSVEIAVWLSEVGLVYHAPILSYHGNCYLRLGFYSKHQSERPNQNLVITKHDHLCFCYLLFVFNQFLIYSSVIC